MGGGRGGLGRGGGRVGGGGGVRVDVIEELKFLGKFTKKNWRGVGGGWVGGVWLVCVWGGGGGQGGCEGRIEVFVNIPKKIWGGRGWGGVGSGGGLVGGGGVRVDVNEDLKFL